MNDEHSPRTKATVVKPLSVISKQEQLLEQLQGVYYPTRQNPYRLGEIAPSTMLLSHVPMGTQASSGLS